MGFFFWLGGLAASFVKLDSIYAVFSVWNDYSGSCARILWCELRIRDEAANLTSHMHFCS